MGLTRAALGSAPGTRRNVLLAELNPVQTVPGNIIPRVGAALKMHFAGRTRPRRTGSNRVN